jgi:UDP-N-acetylmuramoyl-tripeptide--D-alanyl-D-alanine ligase
MAELWSAEELAEATGGSLSRRPETALTGVSIDTRTTQAGDIFVAIKGDVHDGHSFVVKAFEAGAGLAVVSRPTDGMRAAGPLLVVDKDPLEAMVKMGIAARARSHARVAAVTGSVGKTSSKEMLKLALSQSGLTHASAASYNNHWGVPLTLARCPREAAYGVFEIGMNHLGEITPLVQQVRPHVALITTVAPVHIGNFSSEEQIADAKAEIFSGIEPGGYAVLNRDNRHYERILAAARGFGVKNTVSFGRHAEADIRMERMASHTACSCITANILGEQVIYKLGMPGEHMAMNSLAVLGVVKLLGADLARAALALVGAKAPKGRGVQMRLDINGASALLIDESYNANPVSMAAALALLRAAPIGKGGRRIAVLGDMLELGEHAERLHAELSEPFEQSGASLLFACGPMMANLWTRTDAARRGAYAKTSAELLEPLLAAVRPGDAIVVKGSLGSRMGLLVEGLKSRYSAAPGDA